MPTRPNEGGAAAAMLFRKSLIQSIQRAARDFSDQINPELKRLGEEIGNFPVSERRDANARIVEGARKAMIESFEDRPYKRAIHNYRTEQQHGKNLRHPGGMLRALERPRMVYSDARVMRIINEEILNQEAAHWKRLNFGAGAGSRGGIQAPGRFDLEDDQTGFIVASMGLEPDPQPGFSMPKGMWLEPGSNTAVKGGAEGEFWPVSELVGKGVSGRRRKPRSTRGIASTNFLDAGVSAMAHGFTEEYGKMVRRHIGQVASGFHVRPIVSS